MSSAIRMGFEVGTGVEVVVPYGHTILTGQTQASGKTTTLEAMARRPRRAGRGTGAVLAFRTKRGEGGFEPRDRVEVVAPFFRERADWQFVQALLEASLRERMKFERAWIMRATRGATSLQAVRENLRGLLGRATKGLDLDMYMMLGAYLDQIIPELTGIRAGDLVLTAGVNVMDLTALSTPVQGLCIAACLDLVNEEMEGVTVVVPESWEQMPQGRNTPVKAAAEVTAHKGGVLENFLWLDCQDLAGVEKTIIRGTRVWGLGVQREANEVERTLKHIPSGLRKPKPNDVMSLERGHFWFCFDKEVRLVYVQPAWLTDDAMARDVALGRAPAPTEPVRLTSMSPEILAVVGRALRRDVVADLETGRAALAPETNSGEEEDEMPGVTEAVEKMRESLDGVIARLDRALAPQAAVSEADPARTAPARKAGTAAPLPSFDATWEDALFMRFRDRFLKDPKVLRVLATEKRIEVSNEVEVVEADGKTLAGRLYLLVKEGFFDEGKTGNQGWLEVRRRGYPSKSNGAPGELYKTLTLLGADGFLTVEGKIYRTAPGAKARVRETGK